MFVPVEVLYKTVKYLALKAVLTAEERFHFCFVKSLVSHCWRDMKTAIRPRGEMSGEILLTVNLRLTKISRNEPGHRPSCIIAVIE